MLTRFLDQRQWRHTSRSEQYWFCQILGWSALTMLSYLSLTLWYNPGQWTHAIHTVLQSVLGLLVSHPLRWVASSQWTAPLARRIAVNSAAIIVAGIAWTALRLTTFAWLTGERVSAADWGGWLNASLIVYGSWAFCYHALKYYRQWLEERDRAHHAQQAALQARATAQEEMLKRLEAETQYKEAQLRMLKYQLSPHFLFNALNSVTAMVRKGDGDSATVMLARIADFLRIALEHDDDLQHTLDEEIEIMELYLAIEKARFGDRLQTAFDVTDEARRADVPSFLLQPLFENALKYAVGRSLEPTLVTLDAWIEGGRVEIRLGDTGPEAGPAGHHPGTTSMGIGLTNVENRLRSSFGSDFRFELAEKRPSGTTVALSFPATFSHSAPLANPPRALAAISAEDADD